LKTVADRRKQVIQRTARAMPFPDFEPTIATLVRRAASRFGDRDFLVADEDRLSFGQLDEQSRHLAKGLLADGITKGARVALLAPNSVDWVLWWCALTRIGAVAVLLNTFVQPPELATMLRHSDATELFSVRRLLAHDFAQELEAAFPSLGGHSDTPLLLRNAPFLRSIRFLDEPGPAWASVPSSDSARVDDAFLLEAESRVGPSDELVVVFTSGSSGPPKAVVHTHGTAVRYSRNILASYIVEYDDVMFSTMPFFWVGGLGTTLLPALHVGSTLVTQSVFDPTTALSTIEAEHVTIVLGWPQQGRTLANHPARAHHDLSSVRWTTMAELVDEHQRPPSIRADTLGMTETFGSHSNFDPYVPLEAAKRGTAGPSLEGIERRIVDPDTGEPVTPNTVGELCVRGYSLMARMLGFERQDTFDKDGWYHTGDLCRVDDDGWIYFVGRIGDMIKTPGGVNVTPSEVEAALIGLPHVSEAYVIGVPETGGGAQVAAAVVLQPGAVDGAGDLVQGLRGQLSAFKVPSQIWLCVKDELPFLDSGKIDKSTLVEMFVERNRDLRGQQ
jgi:acyl-CoA synthetase (AMP-forming)/AMP-acid ligase II